MKLTFTRTQKHWADEVHFELSCRIQLTPEERARLRTYRPPDDLIAFLEEDEIDPEQQEFFLSFASPDVEKALNKETEIKDECETLLDYLKNAQEYGGLVEHEL